MLPPAHRLHRAADFTEVVRRGRRAGTPLLTVHLLPAAAGLEGVDRERVDREGVVPAPARAGLVVSKAVGGSVVRHRTARRLRALLRPRLAGLGDGVQVVESREHFLRLA